MGALDYIQPCLDLPYMHTSLIQITYALFFEAYAGLNVQFLSVILEDMSQVNCNTTKCTSYMPDQAHSTVNNVAFCTNA